MNLWSQFKRLTSKSDLRVGEVIAISTSDNVSKLIDIYGQTFIATGTSIDVGKKAFVKDGIIQQEAPSLPEYTVYV